MSRINVRAKGAGGELEMAKWLQTNFKLQHTPERNLEQVRFKGKGKIQKGMDLVGFPPLCIEVKRCETLAKRHWWLQCVQSCTDEYDVPVVAYRQNKLKWEFLVSAKYIGCRNGFITLEEREFVLFVNKAILGKTDPLDRG